MVNTVDAKKFISDEIKKSNLPAKKAIIWTLNHTVAPWLTRFAKFDEINEIIISGADKYEKDFCRHVTESLDLKIIESGVENLPLVNGKLNGRNHVVVSNHPLGAIDGILLMDTMGQYASPTIFVGKNLMYLENFGDYFTPVKGYKGEELKNILVNLNNVAKSDKLIITFPAGLCSRMQDGVLKDTEWKTGTVKMINKQRDIIPLYFDAKNPDWFYKRVKFLDKFSKNKIISELEFMYQPRALFDNTSSEFQVVYGEPISYEYFKGKSVKEQSNLMQVLKEHVYRLKDDKHAKFEDTLKMYEQVNK